MELHYLRLFNVLASEQSFTRAADLLFISQPALSIQIKKLEDEMGMKLFDKIGNKIVLNDNGKLLFEYTQKIFSIVEEAKQNFLNKKDCISGSITIGGSNTAGTYILPKILGEFKSSYPGININLHIANTDEIAHLVLNNKLDFAVNGGNLVYGSNVCDEKLMEDRLVIAVSPKNALTKKDYILAEDLSGMNFVAHESNSQLYKLTESIIQELDITSKITMSFGSIDAIKQAVAADLGISTIPLSAVSLELSLGLIKELKIDGKDWTYPYSLIYNKNRYLSPASKKLMDMVRAGIKSRSSEQPLVQANN